MADTRRTPCVRRCTLDERNICLGCYRTLEEIVAWHDAASPERENILRRAEDRKACSRRRLWPALLSS